MTGEHPVAVYKWWRLAALILALSLVAGTGLYCAGTTLMQHRRINLETRAIGHVLVIFLKDNKRLPTDTEELYRQEYLVRDEMGRIGIGSKSLRYSGVSVFPSVRSFDHFDRFILNLSNNAQDADCLRVKGPALAREIAGQYSEFIRNTLTNERKPRDGTHLDTTFPASQSQDDGGQKWWDTAVE